MRHSVEIIVNQRKLKNDLPVHVIETTPPDINLVFQVFLGALEKCFLIYFRVFLYF